MLKDFNAPRESSTSNGWRFWIDRGGTFTDVVGSAPDGQVHVHKLLSENPKQYADAALQGIRELMGIEANAPIPAADIEEVRMGTTVATNALLERTGVDTVLLITRGHADALRIGYQARPDIFALDIVLPEQLYQRVIEVDERHSAHGEVLRELDEARVREDLERAYEDGLRSCAIVLMHAYRYPKHEQRIAAIAREIGFTQVSTSHATSPRMRIVGRGDTTVVDAYLSPILHRYARRVASELEGTRLMFMKSDGGLADANFFNGKDAILSGPAGGIVALAGIAKNAGIEQVIGFDMGGTSTDVSHYAGEFERSYETVVAGVRMRAPMMKINTVAAGGGSVLRFDGTKYRVGPDSAGADPGPACYRLGGPLTVTDCNVMLGKLQPEFFPKVFGPNADQPIDTDIVRQKFEALAEEIGEATGDTRTPVEVADGFLRIAIDNMANAIKKISVQRGHDVTEYALNCFGGASAQHACLVADSLGMQSVIVHPYGGVLSAYGMGLAEFSARRETPVNKLLDDALLRSTQPTLERLALAAEEELLAQGCEQDRMQRRLRAQLRYQGTSTTLDIDMDTHEAMRTAFDRAHRRQFGFLMPSRRLELTTAMVQVTSSSGAEAQEHVHESDGSVDATPVAFVDTHMGAKTRKTPVYRRAELLPGMSVEGPAVIQDPVSTIVVEPGWQARISELNHLLMKRVKAREVTFAVGTEVDPVMLEVFNNLFMSIAEQMGHTLQKTSYSANVKERLDFSCAVFDAHAQLVSNAPHIPVHLGSMGASVKTIVQRRAATMKPGDVFMLNDPYNGGTHLPDITVVTPVFSKDGTQVLFYVASRAHHADVGGITPGSMPPDSKTIEEEGVLIDNFHLVKNGALREDAVRELFSSATWPARNIDDNLADLRAQVAANEIGIRELRRMVEHFGADVVHAYMQHVQDNAEEQVRRVLGALKDGEWVYPLDNGAQIQVKITADQQRRSARIDFEGTSAQQASNFNAPTSITRAAVLYVLRTLVKENIPLNEGCLKPVEIHVPDGSMLSPRYPAAVVAGNVEVSQAVTNALYLALNELAASQGTMNNFTFGNETYQYYETICGGAGAGDGFDGTSAVQTHMTNSRLTDPEVLEWRFPVLLESFAIRKQSGGKGRNTGGDGTTRKIRFLEPMTAAILSNMRKHGPPGLAGGDAGASGKQWVDRHDGSRTDLEGRDRTEMAAGDVFVIETPGGGGYGAQD